MLYFSRAALRGSVEKACRPTEVREEASWGVDGWIVIVILFDTVEEKRSGCAKV